MPQKLLSFTNVRTIGYIPIQAKRIRKIGTIQHDNPTRQRYCSEHLKAWNKILQLGPEYRLQMVAEKGSEYL